jgi:hypothetical protein
MIADNHEDNAKIVKELTEANLKIKRLISNLIYVRFQMIECEIGKDDVVKFIDKNFKEMGIGQKEVKR